MTNAYSIRFFKKINHVTPLSLSLIKERQQRHAVIEGAGHENSVPLGCSIQESDHNPRKTLSCRERDVMHRMMQKYAEFLREGRQQNPGGCRSCEEDIAMRKWERACQEMSS